MNIDYITKHAYVVGGAVRDFLLGCPPRDHDFLVVGVAEDDLLTCGFRPVGKAFGVYLHPTTSEEYALPRDPKGTLEADLARRDLTINAMAQGSDGRIIDPCGGMADIKARVLRAAPGFSDDPIRVLRLARFAARLKSEGFTVDPATLGLAQKVSHSGALASSPPDRIWLEIDKALCSVNPQVFIQLMHETGAMKAVLPEIESVYSNPSSFKSMNLAMQHIGDLAPGNVATAWGVLGGSLDANRLAAVHRRLPVPVYAQKLANLVSQFSRKMGELDTQSPEDVLCLLEAMDAFRHPAVVKDFWLASACRQFRQASDSVDLRSGKHLAQAFATASTASAAPHLAKGVHGPELGRAIRQERLENIRSLHIFSEPSVEVVSQPQI